MEKQGDVNRESKAKITSPFWLSTTCREMTRRWSSLRLGSVLNVRK